MTAKRLLGCMMVLMMGLALAGSMSCVRPVMDPSVMLRRRVMMFWKAREEGRQSVVIDGTKYSLYDAFLSSEGKQTLSEREFARRTTLKVRNVEIVSVTWAERQPGRPLRASVTVRFDTPAKFGAWFRGVRVKQDWVLEGNRWMVVMSPKQNPFRKKLL